MINENTLPFLSRFIHYMSLSMNKGRIPQKEKLDLFIENIIKNVEHIIQAKRYFTDTPHTYNEVSQSILCYGLNDWSCISERNIHQIQSQIENALLVFEPRLHNLEMTQTSPEIFTFNVTAKIIFNQEEHKIQFSINLLSSHPDQILTNFSLSPIFR